MFFLLFLMLGVLPGWMPHAVWAQAGQWRAYTSLREVTTLDASGEAVWVGTTGGVYSHLAGSGEVRRYTIAEGLHGVDVSAVAFDPSCGEEGCVWIGYTDGVLDWLDVFSGEVRMYRDIKRADRYPSREINRIVLHGDSLLIATAFGLVVFDAGRREVRDTYDQFGNMEPGTAVRGAVVAPGPAGSSALWLATEQGVAVAPLSTPNLQNPAAWSVERTGLPSEDVHSIAYFTERIYAGTAAGLAVRSGDSTYTPLGPTENVVHDLATTPGLLVAADQFGLFMLDGSGRVARFVSPQYSAPTAIDVTDTGKVWFGDRGEGLVSADVSATGALEFANIRDCGPASPCYPEGPYHNEFRDLEVDASGNLWAAGPAEAGTGFHRMSLEGQWTDFIGRYVPELAQAASFVTVHVQPDGTVWSGSEGYGIVQVTPEGDVTLYDRSNSTLQAAEGTTNPNYVLIGDIASDRDGNVWVTNVTAPLPLHVRSPAGEWTALPFASECSGVSSARGTYRDIYIDTFGQVWLSVADKADLNHELGLLVLDPNGTPAQPADDTCRFFGTEGENGQGLPNLQINAVEEDRDGFLWVATDAGLAYMLNTGFVAEDPNAVFSWPVYADRDQGTYLFRGLKVNDLAIDPANHIWVASDAGVWLARPAEGGYEEVLRFTTADSPLLSDVVNDVEVNPHSGEVFFSTAQGLIGYQGDSVMPVEEPRDLFIYPNPVRLSEGADPVIYIDGLVDATEIMIMSPDGQVVNRFAARGGRVQWDGRDRRSQMVPSGVYLVVAIGQNGEGTAYGKVAVIR